MASPVLGSSLRTTFHGHCASTFTTTNTPSHALSQSHRREAGVEAEFWDVCLDLVLSIIYHFLSPNHLLHPETLSSRLRHSPMTSIDQHPPTPSPLIRPIQMLHQVILHHNRGIFSSQRLWLRRPLSRYLIPRRVQQGSKDTVSRPIEPLTSTSKKERRRARKRISLPNLKPHLHHHRLSLGCQPRRPCHRHLGAGRDELRVQMSKTHDHRP